MTNISKQWKKMKTKKKVCKVCNREVVLWSKGMCQVCWSKWYVQNMHNSTDKGPIERHTSTFSSKGTHSTTKSKKRSVRSRIAPRTIKRQKQEREYVEVKKRVQQQPNCFFCGKPVRNGDDHHLKGRDGDLLTDEKYQVHCHRQCHNDYHFRSIWDWEWRDGFLSRLKELDESLWRKEVMKMYKV